MTGLIQSGSVRINCHFSEKVRKSQEKSGYDPKWSGKSQDLTS